MRVRSRYRLANIDLLQHSPLKERRNQGGAGPYVTNCRVRVLSKKSSIKHLDMNSLPQTNRNRNPSRGQSQQVRRTENRVQNPKKRMSNGRRNSHRDRVGKVESGEHNEAEEPKNPNYSTFNISQIGSRRQVRTVQELTRNCKMEILTRPSRQRAVRRPRRTM